MRARARCGCVPAYRITIVNKDFTASEDVEAAGTDVARTEALRGALNIGTDEICDGKMFFGAEITIQGDGNAPERLMIAIGASSLDNGNPRKKRAEAGIPLM